MATKKVSSKAKTEKYVYSFQNGKAEGNGKMKDVLGGKGAGLAEMTNIGIPVPPGFTITTEVCNYYYKHNKKLPSSFEEQFKNAITKLEKASNKKFGDNKNPLLVSVRSGSKFYAWYDGYNFEFRFKWYYGWSLSPEIKQSSLCLRFLSTFYYDVFWCCSWYW